MNAHSTMTRLVAGLLATSGWGCSLVGPTCVARQQRGNVATIQGEVVAGEVASHLVRYATEGSQNDAHLTWDGDASSNPARIRIFATRAACTDFQPPPAVNTGACTTLASAGWGEIGIARTLVVTHGRGNPEVLGSPPEYKIWVVGDAERSARYSISVTWFYGPDC